MAQQTKRQELESYLAARALHDPCFRERLLEAPKQAIEEEIHLHFPNTLQIKVHEEKLNELHVVLPVDIDTNDIETKDVLPPAQTALQPAVPLPFWKRISRIDRIG